MNYRTVQRKHLADTLTPVGLYLSLRERFPQSILLESSDYRGRENSHSFLCAVPLRRFTAEGRSVAETRFTKHGETVVNQRTVVRAIEVGGLFEEFVSSFVCDSPKSEGANGLFGYLSYDGVQYFEEISLSAPPRPELSLPDLQYTFYRFVISFDHFRNTLTVVENIPEGDTDESEEILQVISRSAGQSADVSAVAPFHRVGEESSNLSDEAHLEQLRRIKSHIFRGDVFQIVPSRRFMQRYEGDDFTLYRALRSLNPSPYLFYFDCGAFRIFGSSPEAQLVTAGGKATIHPIAGTFRRTGDELHDLKEASRLVHDPKENAEHVMLVDLARNDLSRHCYPVEVEEFRAVQFYSHVIHLVSRVSGRFPAETSRSQIPALRILGSSFPAGTLTGAPKYRAMELIDQFEPERRYTYGGCLGFIGFQGESTHAIVIRSFLSAGSTLYYQAGAGVVADSDPQLEREEVHNKLRALRMAFDVAESFRTQGEGA
jgi:anthranilate synthase component 1